MKRYNHLFISAALTIVGANFAFAQATPQQQQCQQEQAQLSAQLAQCMTDDCRQQVQAAIAAHNAQCQ
jgi:hypothetical protein